MSSQDFIAALLKGFSNSFQPLEDSLQSFDSFAVLLASFGWPLAANADFTLITSTFTSISQNIAQLTQAVQGMDSSTSDEQLGKAIGSATQTIHTLVDAIHMLEQQTPILLASPLDRADFWQTFPVELLDFLLYRYLEQHQQMLFGILHFLGILSEDHVLVTKPGRNPYLKRSIYWDRIPKAIAQPQNLFADVYGWGKTFDHLRFVESLMKLLSIFDWPSGLYPPSDDLLNSYYDNGTPPRTRLMLLNTPLYWKIISVGEPKTFGFVTLNLIIMPIPPTGSRTADPAGFVLFPQLSGQAQATEIKLSDSVSISLNGDFDTGSKVIRAEIRPDGVGIVVLENGQILPVQSLSTQAVLTAQFDPPWTLLGTTKSSGLLLTKAHVGLVAAIMDNRTEYKIEVGFDSLNLALDFSEGDGFLQNILGSDKKNIDLSTVISWSSSTGFGFRGQAPLEANIPVHLKVANVLSVDKVYAAFRPTQGNQVALQVALTGRLQLGPVSATVDRVGIQLTLEPRVEPAPPGNLGNLELGFSFKPPNGLGILIDAGDVVGGGFISFNADKQQYTGFLELKLENIQIKAIGLLDTRLPDGSRGYSFLIIITTQFAPLQLGFGFTLNGVGGLAGINRTMQVDVLRAGLRNHSLNAVLFPPDPVRNAPQIISDLRAIFPPVDGRYVFGPMIEIGWGVPALMIASLGILLEVPAPVRLLVIGQIKSALPTDKTALVLFNMDIQGGIDFGAKKLSLDGTIYDSRIVVFALVGGMALRLDWGSNPNFLCSVGGFHPRFQPPPNFPTINRLTGSIGDSDRLRLTLSSYQAFTSNTVQLGADFELHAKAGSFSAHGWFSFDALFIFSPFSFTAEMSAGVEVRYKHWTLLGITLDLLLSGPTPWHAHGTARFHVLFFNVSVTLDVTFGDNTQVTLPSTSPLEPLEQSLQDARNWNATLPAGAEQMVTLTAAKADMGTILMHPLGVLTVRESVVPLGVTITKFGEAAPAEADHLDIASVTFEGQSASPQPLSDYQDYFASGHFFTLTDAQKLAAPSYTQMKAGVSIGTGDLSPTENSDSYKSDSSTRTLQYDTYIVDNLDVPAENNKGSYTLSNINLQAFLGQAAAARSLVRTTGNAKYVVPGTVGAVNVSEPLYVVVNTTDLSFPKEPVVPKSGVSYFEASIALQTHLAANPDLAGTLQFLPLHEVVKP